MISAKNISRQIDKHLILDDISLTLLKGELNVVFGPSGSGKTSLCRCLSLLDIPNIGEIEIFDKLYKFPSKSKLKTSHFPRINFVYQQLFLWPHLTNKQNITIAVKEKDNELFKETIELLEIEDILDRFPNEISLGQKQRVAIARALVLNPEFIFFDEITSALDIVQIKNIVKFIVKLKQKGIGILLVTHNIEYFQKIADKMIFMEKGKIIEMGTPKIITKPASKELINFLG
jgi:ABC-type polar amino acid transport system ATPase subunit